jgi:GTP cyclohydrolase I
MEQDDRSLRAEQDARDAVETLLLSMGEDPKRDGLLETPARVVKAFREMTQGYREDPAEILSKTFDEQSDEMVVLNRIQFYSTCEHHLLPFMGEASVAYLPASRVVGISKLSRVVTCYARRLQVQERMTREIAQAVEKHLNAKGVGVILKAHHLCMGCRGVRQSATELVTSCLLGEFRSDAAVRAEFLQLTGKAHAI